MRAAVTRSFSCATSPLAFSRREHHPENPFHRDCAILNTPAIEAPMKMRLVFILFVVAIAEVALTPSKASAGWGWWGGPGVNI
jgi:hypothetical protein